MRIPLKDISIFDINCGIDRVFDIETCEFGTLNVTTNDYHSEALDVTVRWDGSERDVLINQYHNKYFLIR